MMKMMRMMKTKTMLKMLKSHYIKKLYKYMNMLITSNNEENNDSWTPHSHLKKRIVNHKEMDGQCCSKVKHDVW